MRLQRSRELKNLKRYAYFHRIGSHSSDGDDITGLTDTDSENGFSTIFSVENSPPSRPSDVATYMCLSSSLARTMKTNDSDNAQFRTALRHPPLCYALSVVIAYYMRCWMDKANIAWKCGQWEGGRWRYEGTERNETNEFFPFSFNIHNEWEYVQAI